jgi:hypothetical protein
MTSSLLVGRRVVLRVTIQTRGGQKFRRGSRMVVTRATKSGYSMRRFGVVGHHRSSSEIVGVQRAEFALDWGG